MTYNLDLVSIPSLGRRPEGIEATSWAQIQDGFLRANDNFRKLRAAFERAVANGDLIAAGVITEAMLSSAAKQIVGDVSGTVGVSGSTQVQKIRGVTVDTPGAGQDGQALAYNHGNLDFDWTTLLTLASVPIPLGYTFSTTTTDADPGTGVIRFDNATPASVTVVYVDDLDALGGLDFGPVWDDLAEGDKVWIFQRDTPTKGILAEITSSLATDGTGYWKLNVSILASGSLPDNGAALAVVVIPVQGSGGGGGSSPLTTKGDLYVYTTADARLPIGTDGQVLTADAAESSGMKWATPSGGGGSVTLKSLLLRPGLQLVNAVSFWNGNEWGWPTSTTSSVPTPLNVNTASGDTERRSNRCFDTTPAVNSQIGYRMNSNYLGDYEPQFGMLGYGDVKVPDGDNCILSVGYCNQTALGTGSAPPQHAAMLWQIEGTDSTANFITGDNSTTETTDTGVNLLDGNWHDIAIYTDDGGVTWYCEIDGSLVATHTTTVPGTTTPMYWSVVLNPHTGSGSTGIEVRLSKWELYCNYTGQ